MTTLNPLPPVEEQPIASVAPALANEEDWFKPCALIPVYNHERSLPAVVAALRAADLPCVLVDDGSSPAAAAVIDELAEQSEIELPDGDFETVAGYLLERLGTIPKVRDEFEIDAHRFVVLRATANRIDLVRISKVPPEERAELPA